MLLLILVTPACHDGFKQDKLALVVHEKGMSTVLLEPS